MRDFARLGSERDTRRAVRGVEGAVGTEHLSSGGRAERFAWKEVPHGANAVLSAKRLPNASRPFFFPADFFEALVALKRAAAPSPSLRGNLLRIHMRGEVWGIF